MCDKANKLEKGFTIFNTSIVTQAFKGIDESFSKGDDTLPG